MDLQQRREELEKGAAETNVLNAAFIGLANGLLADLAEYVPTTIDDLRARSGLDAEYLERWIDAAYAHELVDVRDDKVELTELGAAFLPEAEDSMLPLAVQSVLSPRLADRLTSLMRSGEQPGEAILEEFDNVLPWFGRMLEAKFRPFFRREVLPEINVFTQFHEAQGAVLDLGCGNGWYLRELANDVDELVGVGIDSLEASIEDARRATDSNEALSERLAFEVADIFTYRPSNRFDFVTLNRTLHHVWERRDEVFETMDAALADDGRVIIWEPAWPVDRKALRAPRRQMLGMRNLAEHAMGNRLLSPEQVVAWLEGHQMTVDMHQVDEVETIFIARRD